MEHISLFELQSKIKNTLENSLNATYWVVGEISNLGVNNSGHCYLDLIEKGGKNTTLKAKSSAIIWSYKYHMIEDYFTKSTGDSLKNGIKVLVCVKINYSELYGLSLIIEDIDPTYTLGDIERQRLETINALKNDGIFEMNKEIEQEIVIQRIAIISSDKAAGYQDFIEELLNNPYGYQYYPELFVSTMQGDAAEDSIINSLIKISQKAECFDAVVIIRGGGSKSDLACFDSYNLCSCIAQFPLPIITGIGHDKDISIADMVASTPLKTPTAVARYILDRSKSFDDCLETACQMLNNIKNNALVNSGIYIEQLSHSLRNISIKKFETTKTTLENAQKTIEIKSRGIVASNQRDIEDFFSQLKSLSEIKLLKNSAKLNEFQLTVDGFNPLKILSKGYSIISIGEKIISSINEIKENDLIKIRVHDGTFESKIKKINKN